VSTPELSEASGARATTRLPTIGFIVFTTVELMPSSLPMRMRRVSPARCSMGSAVTTATKRRIVKRILNETIPMMSSDYSGPWRPQYLDTMVEAREEGVSCG
jgi:hypothetical protein